MIFHPVGGSIEHLRSIRDIIIGTHCIAILSLSFCAYGFFGITHYLGGKFVSVIGFIFSLFALIAAMGAAGVNGLALPFFIDTIKDLEEQVGSINHVIRYSMALNHMFDYIFMGGMILAVICWSIAIIKDGLKHKWMGYLGLIIAISIVTMFILGFYFLDLSGFRIFVMSFILWILIIGIFMIRESNNI